jgi:hypothetical protein
MFEQAENLPFAVLSTAKEKYKYHCDLCALSDGPTKEYASTRGEFNKLHNPPSRKEKFGPSPRLKVK